ncbi:MAG: alpha/beta fold hydrolase [Oleiphilus sp.]
MDNQLLETKVRGSGQAVVILHGLFGSADNLARVALELEKDYQVFSMDLRNHGSSFHSVEMNYMLMVEDVKRTIEHYGLESVSMFGHSMGGKVAMAFALAFPERVTKLIVADIAPVTYPEHHHAIFKALNSVPLNQVKNRREADDYLKVYVDEVGVRQFLLKSLALSKDKDASWKFNLTAIQKNYSKIIEGQSATKAYLGKVLFIAGGLSDYIKAEHKADILALFPNAKLKVIPETGHWLHAEKPSIFIGICQRFLQEKK